MTFLFFNLLTNSIFSLLCGLIVVGFSIWLFRIEADRWKLFLLSLPFVKIVYDLARGVSTHSILYTGIDPFSLPPKSQSFQIGLGMSKWSPFMNAVFRVKDLSGKEFDATGGDYLLYWVNNKFGHEVPLMILTAVLAISATLIFIRLIQGIRFEIKRRKDRISCKHLETRRLGWRNVDTYISDNFSGTPFTGGIFKPYICLPSNAVSQLSQQELEAVIAHEMGHVRYFDLVVTVSIQILGDLFWFVPGYRWLSRKIDRLREVVADQSAVISGIEPAQLASALLKLKEIPEANDNFILYSAFFRERSLLKERIERLLGKAVERQSRFGWKYKWLRVLVCIAIGGAVINSVFGGNHQTILAQNPEWFIKWLNSMGIHEIEK